MKINLLVVTCIIAFTAFTLPGICDEAIYKDYRITGPYEFENLTLFFFHCRKEVYGDDFVTLEEALSNKMVIVHETGDVGELEVENISDYPVIILSGDIVKGGKQDRVLRYDMVIKPNSGRIPIQSFCVEQGRWSQRGDEQVYHFEGSTKQISSKSLKMAAKYAGSQQEVWNEVAEAQDRLSDKIHSPVTDSESPTSLQLTLENDEVKRHIEEYIDYFNGRIKGSNDITGLAFAINGEINSADLFSSVVLFKKYWPKLIEACATEALSMKNRDSKVGEINITHIVDWLEKAESGREELIKLDKSNTIKIKENEGNVSFENYLDKNQNQWLHRNIIKK